MYYVYIIQSLVDYSYYVGHTNDLDKRLDEHNKGKSKYTRHKVPWKLVYQEIFKTRGEAMKRENEIKRKKRKSYIEWIISSVG